MFGKAVIFIFTIAASLFPANATGLWSRLSENAADTYGYATIRDVRIAGDRIWFLSDSGLGVVSFVTKDKKFSRFRLVNDIPELSIYPEQIVYCDSVRCVISNKYALFYFHDDRCEKMDLPFKRSDGLVMALDPAGRMYANTPVGFARYNGAGWDTINFFSPHTPGKVSSLGIVFDKNGVAWANSLDGLLFRYDGHYVSAVRFDESAIGPIAGLFVTRSGEPRALSGSGKLCSVNESAITAEWSIDKLMFSGDNAVIDSFDAFWCMTESYNTSILTKTLLAQPGGQWRDSSVTAGRIAASALGVIVSTGSAASGYYTWFKWFPANSGEARSFSLRSLLGNASVPEDFAGSGRSFIPPDSMGIYYTAFENNVIRHDAGGCEALPPVDGKVTCLYRQSSGLVAAGTENGLFLQSESGWTRVTELENMEITEVVEDAGGSLWGISGDFIFHRKNGQWELFDTSNASLPPEMFTAIEPDGDGSLWAVKGWTLVRTVDGSRWTTYNSANSILPAKKIRDLYVDSKKRLTVVYAPDIPINDFSDRSVNGCRMVCALWVDTAWNAIDTIVLPDSFTILDSKYPDGCFFNDSRGGLWVNGWNSGSCLYRLYGGAWQKYDMYTTPFWPVRVLSEDDSGLLYMLVKYPPYTNGAEGIVTYLPGDSADNSVLHEMGKTGGRQFRASSLANGTISVSFPASSGTVSLSVCTLAGRRVAQLDTKEMKNGPADVIFKVGCSPGTYLLKMKTSRNVYAAKILLK